MVGQMSSGTVPCFGAKPNVIANHETDDETRRCQRPPKGSRQAGLATLEGHGHWRLSTSRATASAPDEPRTIV
jgi:hypothetical protein